MQWAYQQMPSSIQKIADTVNAGFQKLSEAWQWLQTNIVGKALEYIQNPGKIISDVWGYLSGKFSDLMTWVATQMDNAKQWMWDKAVGLYEYVLDNWKQILMGLIPPEIQLGMKALYDLLTTYAPQIAEFLRKAAADPAGMAQDMWDTAQEYYKIAQTEGEKMMREWCQTPLGE